MNGNMSRGKICDVPADIVFLMDGSDSIHPSDWNRQTNFVANLINNLQIGPTTIHAGVVVYSSQIGETIDLAPFKPKPTSICALLSPLPNDCTYIV
ncbi:hypothetical protein CHS0354_023639 [Potamilus streckersoni]|uniref:VWFA domain-containing protein n=1 Tax=Potamilus streckersoni TaxID=2493646 RepID=A0AAE0SZC1_9BIVA|nr:hypothetical protein CHS0354_023639 [Potamilus streckersoni]